MKLGRNDPCSCGSGRKYKNCCEGKVASLTSPPTAEINLLLALYNAGRFAELEEKARALAGQYPEFGFGWKLLGGALQMQGKNALPAFQKAAELMPDEADAHYNLGVAQKSFGLLADAAASYRRALMIKPDYAEAHSNLGNVLKDLGQLDNAVASYRRALQLKPDSAETHNSLGTALKDLGQLDAALVSIRKAVELKPGYAEAHNSLGVALKNRGQLDDALVSFRRAVELKPGYAEAHNSLGAVLQILSYPEAALASYRRALELQPGLLQNPIYAQLVLPAIPENPASIAEWRERYQNGISALMDIPGTLELGSTSFYLAYHNADDRPIMKALCQLFHARVPDLTFTAPHVPDWRPPSERGQRIRVGFLSEYLCDHTIGKHYLGLISHLDRNRFEVMVIHGPKSKRDAFRQNLDASADKVITLPSRLKSQQQAVAAEQLDVLFYPDIGMVPTTYFLAYARLAPVQATSWGHPDTTGLDTMDYYVAAVSNEPEQAEANYTERLIRLNRLPCFYYPASTVSIPKLSKAELGLPETGILYGCPQSLFKLHPDFDAVLAAIADGDPTGHLILPEGIYSAWTDLLKARWAKTFPILLERVVFLPFMPFDYFMAVMAQMDVLLDPLHFGSGNTFYDAMVNGTPVVTWPGRFGRGRNVAAAYRQMGVADAPIAQQLEDYAPLALALGRDAERRRALREASLEAAKRELFEDMQAVREFEAFLEDAVAATGRGELLPTGWRPSIT